MSTPPRYNLEVGSRFSSPLSPFNPIPAAQCLLLTQNKSESEDARGVTSDGVHRRQPNLGSDLRSRGGGGSLTGLLVTQEAAAHMKKKQMPLLLSGSGPNEALMSQ